MHKHKHTHTQIRHYKIYLNNDDESVPPVCQQHKPVPAEAPVRHRPSGKRRNRTGKDLPVVLSGLNSTMTTGPPIKQWRPISGPIIPGWKWISRQISDHSYSHHVTSPFRLNASNKSYLLPPFPFPSLKGGLGEGGKGGGGSTLTGGMVTVPRGSTDDRYLALASATSSPPLHR